MFARLGALQHEDMLTLQVKNTMLHLNGQNLRLAAKNGRHSKTPGLHLSAPHVKEATGRLTASASTQEGTAQVDSVVLKSPRPQAENQPSRRPLKLAPLPEEVREAQRQKLKVIQQEAKPPSCKLELLSEPRARKTKSCARQRLVKAAACPPEPLKAQQQNRPQLTRCYPVEENGGRHLEEVVCRGTPAPLCSKPAPPLLSHRIKAQAAHIGEAARQNPGALQQDSGRRRLMLRRAQCLEEDQRNSNTSTGGLSADEGKLAQGVQGKGQRAERARRGQPHAGNGIKEPPAPAASGERGGARSSHREDGGQQSAGCTVNQQTAEGGRGEHTLDGVKLSAPNGRLKRKKPLITKHNNAVPLERLQL